MNTDKTYSRMDIKATLVEAYESTYGIFDYTKAGKDDVLAPVAYREAEDVEDFSVYREYAKRFRKRKVKEVFGISWLEFLTLPKSRALALLDEAGLDAEEQKALFNSIANGKKDPLGSGNKP